MLHICHALFVIVPIARSFLADVSDSLSLCSLVQFVVFTSYQWDRLALLSATLLFTIVISSSLTAATTAAVAAVEIIPCASIVAWRARARLLPFNLSSKIRQMVTLCHSELDSRHLYAGNGLAIGRAQIHYNKKHHHHHHNHFLFINASVNP